MEEALFSGGHMKFKPVLGYGDVVYWIDNWPFEVLCGSIREVHMGDSVGETYVVVYKHRITDADIRVEKPLYELYTSEADAVAALQQKLYVSRDAQLTVVNHNIKHYTAKLNELKKQKKELERLMKEGQKNDQRR